jgi:phosphoglucosamine mutase
MDEYPQQLESFKVPSRPALESLTDFQQLLKEADRALGKHGRHLIRYSGTENKARVLVEHPDQETVSYWSERLSAALLQSISASISL